MILKGCCICLDSTHTLRKLDAKDRDNIKLLNKLNYVAPEQKWLDTLAICKECNVLLDSAYNFKELCLRNDRLRIEFSWQSKHIIGPSDSPHNFENYLEAETLSVKAETENIPDYIEEQEATHITRKVLSVKWPKNIFICFHCNRKFKLKHTLEQHLKNHSNVCSQCLKIFITKKELKIHAKTHSDFNPKSTKFQCEVCGEYFSLLKNILEHCSVVHSINSKDVKPYWCTQCKNKFSSSTLLMQHKKYHDGDRTYVCSVCGKSFITKRDLSGHEKLHDNQRKYGCDKCNKSFNTSQNLKTHIYVVHTDPKEWKYACPVCLKRFAMRANFSEHVKRHQGNKDYTCHICKKAFVSKQEVKKHIRLHSNIAPFKCTRCQKNYRDKRSLDLHMSRTHGIGIVKLPIRVKKFVCHVCPSQFFDNNKLQRHIRTHTGIKPYACHGCDKRFTDKSYLSHHLKSVHHIRNSVKDDYFGQYSEPNF